MSELLVNTIKKADGTGSLSVPAESGTVVTTASPSLGRRNLIINGAMQVAQRGTSTTGVTTTDGYYACDRWRTQTDYGTWTISQDTDSPNGFSNSLKMLCTSGGTSNSDEISLRYYFEGQDVQGLAYGTSDAKQVTASFWIKSNTTGTYTLRFYIEDTGTPEVSKTFTVDAADTWEYKTVTAPANTSYSVGNDNTLGLGLFWYFGAASSFTSSPLNESWGTSVSANSVNSDIPGLGGSTNDYVNITGVQLEVGSVATPFEHRSYGEELALCQRYYFKNQATEAYSWFGTGLVATTTSHRFIAYLPCEMRSTPTVGSGGNLRAYDGASAISVSSVSITNNGRITPLIVFTTSSGLAVGRAVLCGSDNDATAYIDLDAEL